MSAGGRTPLRPRLLGALALVSALAAACGSNVPVGELEAANGLAEVPLHGATSASSHPAPGDAGASVPGAALGAGRRGAGRGASATGPGGGGAAEGLAQGGGGGAGAGNGRRGTASGVRSPIKLGAFGTQSGPIGAILADAPVAIRAWVADVNARGGLNGHPVEVSIADDGGDPGRALSIARRMVEDEGVLAFYGIFGAATMHTVTPYLEEHRIPAVGSVPHPSVEYSPVFFVPETANVEINRGYLTALAELSDVTRVATMACREADSCPKALADMREYAPKVGIEIVHEAQVSLAQPDYTAEVLAARNAGAEAVVVVLDAPSMLRIIRSAHRQNWRPVFSGGAAMYTEGFAAEGDDVEGVISFGTVPAFSASPLMQPYRDAVARWVPGGRLGDFGAEMWVGGKLWERIAPSFGETVARADVFAALHALEDETLGGLVPPLEFPEERTEVTNRCVYLVRVEEGRWSTPRGDDPVCNVR